MGIPPVRLLDKVRQCIRLKGYSIRTEKSYVSWIKRFILKVVRNFQARWLSYAEAQLCHPPTGGRL